MSKVFNDVAVFMKAVGQNYPSEPSKRTQLSELYFKLVVEEYKEFIQSYEYKDDVGELDACFDLMWVIIGYMHSRGWDCNSAWDEGAKSNLSKIDPETGVVRRREDGKVLKPEGWQSPNFKQFVKE